MQLPSFPKVPLAEYNYSESQLIACDVIIQAFGSLFHDLFFRADGDRCPTPVKFVVVKKKKKDQGAGSACEKAVPQFCQKH